MRSWQSLALLAAVGVVVSGCFGSAPVDAPFVNAGSAASAAMKQYDANGDGELSEEELNKAPGIKEALKTSDANRDGMLSQGELKARVAKMVGDEVGLMSLSLKVTANGQALPGATVKLIPDPCLGPNFKTAEGVTDASGTVSPRMDERTPGVQCGWFRIEVSKQEGGQETVPAKFNTETKYGVEVALDRPELERPIPLDLKADPK